MRRGADVEGTIPKFIGAQHKHRFAFAHSKGRCILNPLIFEHIRRDLYQCCSRTDEQLVKNINPMENTVHNLKDLNFLQCFCNCIEQVAAVPWIGRWFCDRKFVTDHCA